MFTKFCNIEECKQAIIKVINNMVKGQMRASKLQRGEQYQFTDNMQYLMMYALGTIKSQTVVVPQVSQQIDTVDKVVYMRYLINTMSCDESLAMFNPQIISVSDKNLNENEYPSLESLERRTIRNDQIYLMYNAVSIYVYVGRYTDPYFINEIFKVQDISQIDKAMSEDEIFANVIESAYLTALYGIIGQIRYQRQPFCELIILIEGEVESEQILQGMCVNDELANQRFRHDFGKFL